MTRTKTRIFFLVLSLSSLQCYYSSPIGLPKERNLYEAERDPQMRSASGRTNDQTIAEEKAGLFEGDIDMDDGMKQALIGGKLMSRDGVVAPIFHWPEATMLYDFDEDFPDDTRERVSKAMNYISSKTCIRFKLHRPSSDEENSYVKFIQGNGCYSRIGRDPRGRMQKISIGEGCERAGTIEHEISHALGFFHEHTRPDRKNYITILFENIKRKHASNFRAYDPHIGSSFHKPYDYNSVMHYSKYAFSNDGLPTILTRNPNDKIGQRRCLSDCDIYQLNKVYCDRGVKAEHNNDELLKKCKESVNRHEYFTSKDQCP